jgi:hypothetical protein
MATTIDGYFSLVRISSSSWAAVHVNQEDQVKDDATESLAAAEPKNRTSTDATGRLFGQASAARVAFTERFPRLTIALISVTLCAASLTAEVEWLRHAGYYWR